MKRTFRKVRVTNRQSASLSDAPLRPYHRYTTANRQAVPGLQSGADVLSAPLRALWWFPPRTSVRRPPEMPSASRVLDKVLSIRKNHKI